MRVVGARDKAVQLVSNLEHSRHFLQPRITGESAESTGNGAQQVEPVSMTSRVNFDLLADYNPAVPGDRKATSKKAGPPAGQSSDAAAAGGRAATPRTGSSGRQRTPYSGTPRAARRKNSNQNPGGPR
jgi:type IV pilus assembly protein PilN